jgi:hypothetical protein
LDQVKARTTATYVQEFQKDFVQKIFGFGKDIN